MAPFYLSSSWGKFQEALSLLQLILAGTVRKRQEASRAQYTRVKKKTEIKQKYHWDDFKSYSNLSGVNDMLFYEQDSTMRI